LNPVRATGGRLALVSAAHLARRDEDLVRVAPLLDRSASPIPISIETEPSAEPLSALRAACGQRFRNDGRY